MLCLGAIVTQHPTGRLWLDIFRKRYKSSSECLYGKRRLKKIFAAQQHLLPLFAYHFGYFFPFLDLKPEKPGSITPDYLLNIACALAARFSPLYNETSGQSHHAEQWANEAKKRVSKMIAVTSPDMVKALLLISWYEFGEDRDAVSDMTVDGKLISGFMDVSYLVLQS